MPYVPGVISWNSDSSLLAIVPQKQLNKQSFQLLIPHRKLTEWTPEADADFYSIMQGMTHAWEGNNFTDQYLIYGRDDSDVFRWEIVPFKKCNNFIKRLVQAVLVLWRALFGGFTVSYNNGTDQEKVYRWYLNKASLHNMPKVKGIAEKGYDYYCKKDVILSKWVVVGKNVNILFNPTPLISSSDRLDFVISPKYHRETFGYVTQDEFVETFDLARKLIVHIKEKRKDIKNVILFSQNGTDVGQSIKHWNLKIHFSTNAAKSFWDNMKVIASVLKRPAPMKDADAEKRVSNLREELTALSLYK